MPPSPHSMRYLGFLFLCFFLISGPLTPVAVARESKPAKRPAGKQSSLASVRKKPKYNLKPLVYDPKKNRPNVVKKKHWWQKK